MLALHQFFTDCRPIQERKSKGVGVEAAVLLMLVSGFMVVSALLSASVPQIKP
jgi:hypothetical protein